MIPDRCFKKIQIGDTLCMYQTVSGGATQKIESVKIGKYLVIGFDKSPFDNCEMYPVVKSQINNYNVRVSQTWIDRIIKKCPQ